MAAEDPLVTVESDKATMDVPAPFAGTVTQMRVPIGDRVSEGSVLLVIRRRAPTETPASSDAGRRPTAGRRPASNGAEPDAPGHTRGTPPPPATVTATTTLRCS